MYNHARRAEGGELRAKSLSPLSRACPPPSPQPTPAAQHLRPASLLPSEQLLLPFPKLTWEGKYIGTRAFLIESALKELRTAAEGRARHKRALGQLLRALLPQLQQAARARWKPGCRLSQVELVHEGVQELLQLKVWLRFTPGQGGKGRTLFPAYALRVARQGMSRALQDSVPVRATRWGKRRLQAAVAAQEKVVREVPYRHLVNGAWVDRVARIEETASPLAGDMALTPGARAAAELAESGVRQVPLEHAQHLASPHEEALVARGEQAAAVAALQRLPRAVRLAVAAPMGLLREGVVSDSQVARRLSLTVEQVERLRALGLEQLREQLAEAA